MLHRTDVVQSATGRSIRFDVMSASGFVGETREAILALKYRNERGTARVLASLLVDLLPDGAEIITWAPTTHRRRTARGVDHAELIARHLAAFTGVPARGMLRRVGESRQTGSSREQREHSVVFVARREPRPFSVVVVDDVVTTGATMRAAVLSLGSAGHRVAACLTVASVE